MSASSSILYFKAARLPNTPIAVESYAATHPHFPHESTVDQFFDERSSRRTFSSASTCAALYGDVALQEGLAAASASDGTGAEVGSARHGPVEHGVSRARA